MSRVCRCLRPDASLRDPPKRAVGGSRSPHKVFAVCARLFREHFYSTSNQRFDLEKGDEVAGEFTPVEWMRQPATQVRVKYERHCQEYLKGIPAL